ncbi:MAG: HNH endonuclease [Acidimicrobiales bacterium]|nr:HNH endonuclease [Acidimicrobiales bacterium]
MPTTSTIDAPARGARPVGTSGVSEQAEASFATYLAATEELAAVAGIINAGFGRLVDLAVLTLAEGHHVGPGLHSPSHYLCWQTGIDRGTAAKVLRIARRAEELPCLLGALRNGEVSLDQATVVAALAPANYDEAATLLAHSADVKQLRSILRSYAYEEGDGDADRRPAPQSGVSVARDRDGATIRVRTSTEAADAFQHALDALTADLQRQHDADRLSEGVEPGERSIATSLDGFEALCEAGLRWGEAAHPGSERYLINLHLHTDVHGQPMLTDDRGRVVDRARRRHLLCDATFEAVLHDDRGTAISVGRKTRNIGSKLRRAVLFRDRHRCTVPGCHTSFGLQIHHIRHWEDLGSTDISNLTTLCGRHHRLHHQGVLDIEGNPELPAGTPGALAFVIPGAPAPLPAVQPATPLGAKHTQPTLERLRAELHARTLHRRYRRAHPHPDQRPDGTPRGPLASTPTGEPVQRSTVYLAPARSG